MQNISHKNLLESDCRRYLLSCEEKPPFILTLSFLRYMGQVGIALHLSTLSHTLCVSRWGKARILRKGRFYRRRQKKKNMKLTLAGQDVYGGCMRGHVQSWHRDQKLWVVEAGWQRRSQFLRNIRMKVQNLATCLGGKGRSCGRISWGLEERDTKALTDRDHRRRADKWEGQNAGNWDSVSYTGQE